MTEQEWLESREPVGLLKASRSRFRLRKLRLFAVACCRFNWHAFSDDRCRRAVEVAEQFVEEKVGVYELGLAAEVAEAAHDDCFRQKGKRGACLDWAAVYVTAKQAWHAARNVSWMSATAREVGGVTGADYFTQANLVRDIIANPFRPMTVDSAWLRWNCGTVLHVAQLAYEERHLPSGELDRGRLAILADALENSGCTDADILGHLRGPGPHVRGCWAVDLLLGKS